MNDTKEFYKNYILSSNWWHQNIMPKLPTDIQEKIQKSKYFIQYYEIDKYFIKVDSEEIDITKYIKNIKIKNIFDFYNKNRSKK